MEYLLLVVGFVLLVKCADMFVDGASNLAKALGVSGLIIGLTVVAFGTSAPELAVSVSAALSGQNDICVGNVTGSNVCNTLLVLGMSALFFPLSTDDEVRKRDLPFMIAAEVLLLAMAAGPFIFGYPALIYRAEGAILLAGIVFYLIKTIRDAKSKNEEIAVTQVFTEGETYKIKPRDIIFIIVGIAGVIFGGDLVVDSAVEIATALGLSTQLIALTIVAIGTSLPELVTSVMAARKHEADIAIGNVIGSNIFNIFMIIGAATTICPVTVNIRTVFDAACVLVSGILVLLFVTYNDNHISRREGAILLLAYIAFLVYICMR